MSSVTLEPGWDDHFAYNGSTTDDRFRRNSRLSSRDGRTSPAHSAHDNLLRHSLMKITMQKKAKKVRFYRNGDRFFKGMVYAVSPERFRTFDTLLANLTDSAVGDKKVLPNGVRHIFSIDGSRRIVNLDQLREGDSYVCASTDVFRRAEYDNSAVPSWNAHHAANRFKSGDSTERSSDEPSIIRGALRPNFATLDNRDYIKPKLITIVRSGSKPRKAVRVLLNRKTAHSFDQVLTDITDAIQLDSGSVKRIFTLDGRPVETLADFFNDDTIFVAYGNERTSNDDFDLQDNEVRLVAPYKPRPSTGRVTLRSAKSSRQSSVSSVKSEDDSNGFRSKSPSSPVHLSPRSPRKTRAVSAPKYKTHNGPDGEQYLGGPPSLAAKYEIGKKIGEGNFAIVKECISRKNNKRYALKIIEKEKCRGKEQMIQNEVAILRKMKHANIIELIEEFNSHTELYLVMELIRGGDLFDAISMATKYSEKDACAMVFNLASALAYLHGLHIVHRDVKPENLLVCDHGDGTKSLKLGDFGLATDCTEPLYTVCGTPTYVAPEILSEQGYGAKVDVWAAGVIMYILLCGFPPFTSETNDQEELFDAILSDKLDFPSPYWDGVSQQAKDLLAKMLEKNPDKRYSAADAQTHDWVTAEGVSSNDIQATVAEEIKSHFHRKPKPSISSAGIRLVAATALDKASRYFDGRKPQLTLPDDSHEDGGSEVF